MSSNQTHLMRRRRQRGATLVEALIAFVVMAVGLTGYMALQARLRVNSDVAKQRAEAVRLAEEDIENLRAFGTLVADGTVANNLAYASVTTGAAAKALLATSVTTTTNATYTITRSVVDSATAKMKDLRVTVDWTDRTDTAQRVVLRSLIAGIDPRLAAAMTIPPNGSPVKDLLGRDIQVPIPAKNLGGAGGGTSVFKPQSFGTLAYVFNNDTGLVTKKCTVDPTAYTAALTTADLTTSNCTDVNAVLLSGYIRFSFANNPSASDPNDAPPGSQAPPLSMRLDLDDESPPTGSKGTATQVTEAYWPSAIQSTWVDGYTPPECAAEDSKTVTFTRPASYSQINDGVTQTATSTRETLIVPASTPVTAAGIAPYANLAAADVQNPAAVGDRYVAYTCVVYPRSVAGTLAWTGRALIVPAADWVIGTASTEYKVCRYSADYNLNGYVWTVDGSNVAKIDNPEHPYAYLMATGSLSNQNYLVVRGNKNCPTDGAVEVDGTGGENYTDETTVRHQP